MDELPLRGRTIVVTRSAKQSEAFCSQLEQLGAKVLSLPMIDIIPPQDPEPFHQAVQQITQYNWVMVTSQNGVVAFCYALQEEGIVPSQLTNRFVTVGKKTKKAMENCGIQVELMPEKFVAEEIWALLQHQVKAGEQVLYLRGNLARPYLIEQLEQAGLHVDAPVCYETVPAQGSIKPLYEQLLKQKVDAITFTSPSTVHYMIQGLQTLQSTLPITELLCNVRLLAIGPITAQALQAHELPVHGMAEEHTVDGLVVTLCKLFSETSQR
ncbi:uroporphyrinogen-III synthase [Rubeoparvulum massiliense]|uniref:uroporphyrinogen-III synthase n=1 Tax=Rubeoparvulum massiliense TaxID=1631346 RepID=UPI00065E1088|nr:uroporphyrinogen-III synthase [Rubeoparvulum massiliense]